MLNLRSDNGFADERDGNADCTEEQRLSAADTVEQEDNEEEVEDRADDVVDAGYEEIAVADDAEVVVENGGVVADDVDTIGYVSWTWWHTVDEGMSNVPSHLRENLRKCSMHQSRSPD